MASSEELHFNEAHKPQQKAIDAFNDILHTIKAEIRKSRNHWDKHERRMWRRANGISDEDLTSFTIKDDLILVRSAPTPYGTVIIGKIHLPKVKDVDGEPGYIHVRIHDPPNRGTDDIIFHSLFTEEVRPIQENSPTDYCAIHTKDKPLEFFNE